MVLAGPGEDPPTRHRATARVHDSGGRGRHRRPTGTTATVGPGLPTQARHRGPRSSSGPSTSWRCTNQRPIVAGVLRPTHLARGSARGEARRQSRSQGRCLQGERDPRRHPVRCQHRGRGSIRDREPCVLVGTGPGRPMTCSSAGEIRVAFVHEGVDRLGQVVGDEKRRVPLRHVVERLVDGAPVVCLNDPLHPLGHQW